VANNGSAKIISKKRVVYARPGRSGHRLAIIPNPVCVGVVASHILAADADADPIRWRQARIPADSIFASCRNFPPDPVEIRRFSKTPNHRRACLPCRADGKPALTGRTRDPNSFPFTFSRSQVVACDECCAVSAASGQRIEEDQKEGTSENELE